jgi:Family of unknown function (DUF6230)
MSAKDPTPDASASPANGATRWRRFGLTMLGSTVVAAGLIMATAQGVLAAQFSLSGQPFTVTASRLEGTGFEQFATLDTLPENSPNAGDTGGQLVLVVSAIRDAKLFDLCQSISLGGINLRITAGGNGNPVTAHTLVVDSDEISGDATFTNIEIGGDASELTQVPGVTGPLGLFSQNADTVVITGLRQDNFATTAASFHLTGLHIGFSGDGC